MKLYTFEHKGSQRIGAEVNGQLMDLKVAHALLLAAQGHQLGRPAEKNREEALPDEMLNLLRLGADGMTAVRQAVAHAVDTPTAACDEPLSYTFEEVRLMAPLTRPGKILCSGINYRGHLEENPGAKLPESPFFFSKLPTAVIGPQHPIVHPRLTRQLDYEVELAVVIGRKMRHTPEIEVMGSIAGYTILHDVSARDVQFKDNQITLGKNFDTFAPMGPCLVTADELSNPENLRLRTLLNGQVMQDGSTSDWVFPLPKLLSILSEVMTLEPGDVVSTGTPAGVGAFRKPPVFLKPGDRVILEIEGIGRLENPVTEE
jgi:2,4-didehydro-3-deoxy-L-rhamnonate hydrolase